jgi:glycosyltransferase involved in cell wall biosynthesis
VAEYLNNYVEAQGKVYVVPNGVDPDRFDHRSKMLNPNFSPEDFVIGFVGTMKPWHDLQTLVDAFALFYEQEPQGRLLLIGDGPIKSQIEAQIKQRGCSDAVHFTGAVTSAEIPQLLASMDVAVAPYPLATNSYFSPLKVYEYMAAGLAVIASEVGQLQELIDDGINGLLCPQENSCVLAEKLQYLKANPELRLRLGQTARQQVIANHTWDAVVTKLLKLAGSNQQQETKLMEIGG